MGIIKKKPSAPDTTPMPKGSLAIALNMSRPKKKMAKGGDVQYPDVGIGNDPMPGKTTRPVSKDDNSVSIKAANDSYAGVDKKADAAAAKANSGYAKGGVVKKKHPMLADSMLKVRLRDEADMEASMPPKKTDGMSEDKGPSEEEFMSKKMAEGGKVPHFKRPEEDGKKAEMDDQVDPPGLESDDDEIKPSEEEIMAGKMMAEGGMLTDEEEEDHHASVAAAIMAKRRKMAEGGQVDIESNEHDEPYAGTYNKTNEANLKEDYGDDLNDISQPKDSNEHGHELSDEDEHDMVAIIRKRMRKAGM